MTKQELEQKIKNEESVWVVNYNKKSISEIKHYKYIKKLISSNREITNLELIFPTKEQAQHYLDNGNVKRTEQMPYITWEEFKNGEVIQFYTHNGEDVQIMKKQNICIWLDYDLIFREKATEENFYKAYEKCKQLFLGE